MKSGRLFSGSGRVGLTILGLVHNCYLPLVHKNQEKTAIFGFFNGLGGMAVVAAFWGIWHAISGIGLAMIMARKPVHP